MRKVRAFNKTTIAIAVSTVFLLSACAGGGGGGANNPGGGAPPAYLRTEVPFSTPVKVATIDPLTVVGGAIAVMDSFTANITGSGQDLIIAGRQTQPATVANWSTSKISMLSWQNGTLVDKTAQWFPKDSNVILGADASIKFADFFKSGRTDMFVAPQTDMELYGPAYLYQNTGSNFNRLTIPLNNVWVHDTAVHDLNGDGYADIVLVGYGPNMTVGINNKVNGFKTYTSSNGPGPAASAIAVADFLGNGTKTFVLTDTDSNNPTTATMLYKWNIDSSDNLSYTPLKALPQPIFTQPQWASYGFGGSTYGPSHVLRAVAYDFVGNGIPSVILFDSAAATTVPGKDKYSAIQFLKNDGQGNFTDVTNDLLVGYNYNTYQTYNPKFIDVNGDGLTDILVSSSDYSGKNNSSQILLRSKDGKYVAAYQNILTDFNSQASQLQNTDTSANTINLVKGPNGKLYLTTITSFMNGADLQMAVYLSDLGSGNTITAQNAIDMIKAKWPYMTNVQANTALAMTSASYMTGAGSGLIIDPDAFMRPYGSLGISTARGMKSIQGYITGVDIGDGNAVGMDSLGRGFNLNIKNMNNSNALNSFMMNTEHIDQFNLTSHAEYLINGSVNTFNGIRVGSENRNAGNTFAGRDEGPSLLPKPTQYTFGIPEVYRKGNFSYGMQYTSLNSNPWLALGGAWGSVNNSSILDNVVTYRNGGFSAQGGVMRVTTLITPGLVTNVSNITGAWSETGYRYNNDKFGDIGFYAGIKPTVLSGSVTANLPTGVDNNGNTVYTKKNLALQNDIVGYGRMLYTNMLDKNTMYRFSAMATQQGQYRLMHELKFWID